jgi:mono/diheme cytochrome c family protein
VIVAVAAGLKAALAVLLIVLIPTVPFTWVMTRSMRRRTDHGVASGRSDATPFVLISVIGTGITLVVFAALLIAVGAQWLVREDGSTSDPVAGDAGSTSRIATDAQLVEQGDPTAGKRVFTRSRCGTCHTLADAGARGTRGPSLDQNQPDFTRVVECVTTGPGDMPTFTQLSNAEIRNVATYVSVVAGRQS